MLVVIVLSTWIGLGVTAVLLYWLSKRAGEAEHA
jgi:putative effector of murein hydrolase LrgA (UPF0299 family)